MLFKEGDFRWQEPDSARSFHLKLRALYHTNLTGIGQNEIR